MNRDPPPRSAYCINCKTDFIDIWAYKQHQDACIASTNDSEDSEEDEDE